MVELIKLKNNIPVISSINIAKGFDVKHRAVLELIRAYESDLQDFQSFTFQTEKSGGRPMSYCYLNEEQTAFLITLMKNSKKSVTFKKKLTKEFFRLRDTLQQIAANQKNVEWLEKRKQGKTARISETDEIKNFVEYAKSQGSKNAEKYYMLLTSMENKALFFLEQKFKNVREVLKGHQLETISNADRIISRQLQKCVDEKRPYKDGYKMAKKAIESFSDLIGKTLVPMSNQKQIN